MNSAIQDFRSRKKEKNALKKSLCKSQFSSIQEIQKKNECNNIIYIIIKSKLWIHTYILLYNTLATITEFKRRVQH